MEAIHRQFAVFFGAVIVLAAGSSLAALMPGVRLASWALGPLAFLTLLAMGILFRRKGIDLAWLAKAALMGAVAFVACSAGASALSFRLANPEGLRTAFQPVWTLLSIPGALVGIALPVVLGGILGGVPQTEDDRPKFLSLPPWGPTVAVGLIPLGHVVFLVQARPGHVEFPSLGILFITAPIGILMALVGLVLSAVKHRYGPPLTVGTLVYGIGAFLLIMGMKAIGVRFTFPP